MRNWIKWFLLCVGLSMPPVALADTDLEVTFLNVGKADAIILQTENSTVMIDTGKDKAGKDIVDFLQNRGIEDVDLLIITHFDKDHVGGADRVIKKLHVSRVFVPDYFCESKQYLEFMDAVEETQTPLEVLSENTQLSIDGIEYRIDVANESYYGEDEENDFSLVTGVYDGDVSILFAGDAENPRLKELIAEKIGHFDVLKVPHHGVLEKKSEAFIKMVSPSYAVITSDLDQLEDETLVALLEKQGTEVYLTRNGTVVLTTDGQTITITQNTGD